jgi:8-oxo-dGTP pyrophosphatase MutT (NUDIX family)
LAPDDDAQGEVPPRSLIARTDPRILRLAGRLMPEPDTAGERELEPDWTPPAPFFDPAVPAAVLIALVHRHGEFSVLYTQRSGVLRSHSGQVAFPGGKIDEGDSGPGAAALREAQEEVALDPLDAEVLGYLPNYFAGSNYLITPVVALVEPKAAFVANPDEVTGVFEVPLALLSDSANFGRYRIRHDGEEVHSTWQIDHAGYTIWGITANLTRQFHEIALKGESVW